MCVIVYQNMPCDVKKYFVPQDFRSTKFSEKFINLSCFEKHTCGLKNLKVDLKIVTLVIRTLAVIFFGCPFVIIFHIYYSD